MGQSTRNIVPKIYWWQMSSSSTIYFGDIIFWFFLLSGGFISSMLTQKYSSILLFQDARWIPTTHISPRLVCIIIPYFVMHLDSIFNGIFQVSCLPFKPPFIYRWGWKKCTSLANCPKIIERHIDHAYRYCRVRHDVVKIGLNTVQNTVGIAWRKITRQKSIYSEKTDPITRTSNNLWIYYLNDTGYIFYLKYESILVIGSGEMGRPETREKLIDRQSESMSYFTSNHQKCLYLQTNSIYNTVGLQTSVLGDHLTISQLLSYFLYF